MIIAILLFLFIGSIVAYALGDAAIITLEAAEKAQKKKNDDSKWWMTRSEKRKDKIQQLKKKRDEIRKGYK